jgi:hypothetical protein
MFNLEIDSKLRGWQGVGSLCPASILCGLREVSSSSAVPTSRRDDDILALQRCAKGRPFFGAAHVEKAAQAAACPAAGKACTLTCSAR